ncbi:hypothetical protein [Thermococcus sp. AM4]|uniref:hypothetical protein n=1 Tax=Thermococcus sp. (strain AM4) TaxID=246969 RepID=UPI000187012F|nr:hypothetical protein [Thermococcus sp. AM4]EEB74782.1 hypothetical protein TAM4_727 [Thermococcus sp. AM4]
MPTWKAVKWYFRGLFPPVTTAVLFLFMLAAAYSSLGSIKNQGPGQFVTLMEYIFLPVYGVLIASHIMRDSKTTVFELSIFNGPRTVYWVRVFIVALGLAPGIVGIAAMTWLRGYHSFAVSLLLKLPAYTAFAAIIAAVLDSLAGSITFFILTSAIPMSFRVLLQSNGSTGGIMAALSYVFAPMTTVEFRKAILMPRTTGYVILISLSALLLLLGYAMFERREYSP